jgi:hypothetical protein
MSVATAIATSDAARLQMNVRDIAAEPAPLL